MSLSEKFKSGEAKIAVVGLGYVGLPLAVAFGKIGPTIGFDVNQKRIDNLQKGIDTNNDVERENIRSAKKLEYTTDAARLKDARFIAVAVPTPINASKQPDLIYVEKATITVAQNLSKGTVVVFEPTVYPGVTEDICVPLLEKHSGLKYKKDFKVGYSPERINPGDREHTVETIIKVVSGCDEEALDEIAAMYEVIVKAGVYRASSIKTAEAAKVIENTQRDLNIALMNELALIFHKIGIDTREVIEAAGTKWNFIKMYPGLVGGHCIGVDPYYLTWKAEAMGYNPQVILAGRKINDNMGKYIAEQCVKKMIAGNKTVKGAKVLILGFTFKENVTDIRNTRVIDIIRELEEFGVEVIVTDPLADAEEVKHEYDGLELQKYEAGLKVDAVILAVNHDEYKKKLTPNVIKNHLTRSTGKGVVIDVKGMFHPGAFGKTPGVLYWRL